MVLRCPECCGEGVQSEGSDVGAEMVCGICRARFDRGSALVTVSEAMAAGEEIAACAAQAREDVEEAEANLRAELAGEIRRLGRGHRDPVALYREAEDEEPVAIGVVEAIESGGVRIAGSLVPWSGLGGVGSAKDMIRRYGLVVVIEAKGSEEAWEAISMCLGGNRWDEMPEVVYVGAPWEGIPADAQDLGTEAITLAMSVPSEAGRLRTAKHALRPCEPGEERPESGA